MENVYLLSTVVAPTFKSGTLKLTALTPKEFMGLCPSVTHNFCGHPVTLSVFAEAGVELPESQRAFWNGDGVAIAARPKGGVRNAQAEGDTLVTGLDQLEFVMFRWIEL